MLEEGASELTEGLRWGSKVGKIFESDPRWKVRTSAGHRSPVKLASRPTRRGSGCTQACLAALELTRCCKATLR